MSDTHFTQKDREDLQRLGDNMRVLMEAVCGDPLHPDKKPGLLALQIASAKEMYGDNETKTVGFKLRFETLVSEVDELKLDKVKVLAGGAALVFAGGLIASAVGWVLVHFKIIPA